MGKWLKRIGIASVAAFPLAVIAYRLGLMEFRAGLSLMQVGAGIGALVFVVGLVYALFVRKSNPSGARAAVVGALIAIIPVVPLALQAKKAKSLPMIHNISTDVSNPPQFVKVKQLRSESDNPHAYDASRKIGEAGTLAQLQQAAYPNVKTLNTNLSVEESLALVQDIVEEFGWELVNVDATSGIVEATETTLLWGFKDDIVIRVVENGTNTNVDLHSVSRFGISDLGVNAARIEKFINRFNSK